MHKVKEVERLTLKILERLNKDKVKSILVSKGVYPEILANQTKFNTFNEYGITIVSLSEDFRKKFEPNAAPINQRLKALKKLHDAGLKTWVSMEPYPTPNVIKQDIREILNNISFVDKIVFGKWNYNKHTRQFLHYRSFYNSMAYEVIKFCAKNSIEVYIKEDTISLDVLPTNQPRERKLLESYVIFS